MRTFAVLLTEYMERTGISDSELARTLGVRRQTIFRWKEGLVERPRHREDVLCCAERLRLSPEERDELLLAAGFSPSAGVVSTPTGAPAASQPPSDPASQTVGTPAPGALPLSRRLPVQAVPRWLWIAGAILLAALGGGLLLVFWPGAGPAFPLAAPGETLIVLAVPAGPIQPPVTPGPGQRLAQGGEPFSVQDRIQAALEREIQAARLQHVRVAHWPEGIRDADSARIARQRSGAKIVIWGRTSGESVLAILAVAPFASRVDDLPLDALVCAPADLPVEVSGDSPAQAQALAQLILGQLYLDQGDFSMAHAALTQALSRSAATPDTLAALYSYLGYAYQASKPPDLIRAVQFYSQAMGLVPNLAGVHQNRGVAYIRQNEPAQWSADFASVLASSPDDVGAHRALCWAYALDRQPELALSHCDAAVSRDSTARSREARGIVYAELGRLPEAATELQAFLDWLAQQPEALRARYGTSRSDWVQALRAGRNPIDETVLGKLRQE